MDQGGGHIISLGVTRRQVVILAAACCGGCALAADPVPLAEAELSNSWRLLRSIKGHFEGGPWTDEVDRWQGRKHVVMQALATMLLQRRADSAGLHRAMGEPDARWVPGQDKHARALEEAQWLGSAGIAGSRASTLWVYRWRGTHDQLLFAVENDRVAAAGWLYRWE